MTRSRSMGCAVAALALVLVSPAHAYTDEAVKTAEAFYKRTIEAYDVGEATTVDLARTQQYFEEMRFRAKQTTRAAYCETVVPLLRKGLAGTEEEHRVGQRNLDDVLNAHRQLYEFLASCGEK